MGCIARHCWAAALVACCLVLSCLATSPGKSQVAQGKLYRTGDSLFDEFFTELHTAQLTMGHARADETAIRERLAQGLVARASQPLDAEAGRGNGAAGSSAIADDTVRHENTPSPMAPLPLIPEKLATEVERQVRQVEPRVKFRVVIDGDLGDDGTTATVTPVGQPHDRDRELAKLIERALDDELLILAGMQGEIRRLERLATMADGLERNVTNVFQRAGMAKHGEVSKNIHDAQAMIPLMQGLAQDIFAIAERTTKKVRSAASTVESIEPAPAPTPPPPPEPQPTKPKAAPPPVRHGPRPPPTSAPPPRRPATSPDFEP